jgi:hypothetical protein
MGLGRRCPTSPQPSPPQGAERGLAAALRAGGLLHRRHVRGERWVLMKPFLMLGQARGMQRVRQYCITRDALMQRYTLVAAGCLSETIACAADGKEFGGRLQDRASLVRRRHELLVVIGIGAFVLDLVEGSAGAS